METIQNIDNLILKLLSTSNPDYDIILKLVDIKSGIYEELFNLKKTAL